MNPLFSTTSPDAYVPGDARLLLWPALAILKKGREEEDSKSLLERVQKWLRPHRLRGEEDVSPRRLKSPAQSRDAIDWLHSVWRRLDAAEISQVVARRRSIMEEIVNSALSIDEQAALFTALDYLFRLRSAQNTAHTAAGSRKVEIPPARSPVMQATYRRIAALAATDLPIWLVGEKGTELEWVARLIHRLRGLSESGFLVWNYRGLESGSRGAPWSYLKEHGPEGADLTVVAGGMDQVPGSIQGSLLRYLVEDLGRPSMFRIIVTSGPLDLRDAVPDHILPDLFAFLDPTRVEIPTLRSRTEDLEGLMGFLARSRSLPDPTSRLVPESLAILRGYHWPGNTEELIMVTTYASKKRPTGPIRPEDLPESVRGRESRDKPLLGILEQIARAEGFRVLASEEGRRRLAQFLSQRVGEKTSAAEVQILLRTGRETTRRLLRSLELQGVVEGIAGAKAQRVTRYLCRKIEEPGEQ